MNPGLQASNRGEWARDDDGDGVREVHDDTPEGPWTGPPNFPRRSRGVSKKYQARYVAMFEWDYNVKRATPGFLGAMLGVQAPHHLPLMSRCFFQPWMSVGWTPWCPVGSLMVLSPL